MTDHRHSAPGPFQFMSPSTMPPHAGPPGHGLSNFILLRPKLAMTTNSVGYSSTWEEKTSSNSCPLSATQGHHSTTSPKCCRSSLKNTRAQTVSPINRFKTGFVKVTRVLFRVFEVHIFTEFRHAVLRPTEREALGVKYGCLRFSHFLSGDPGFTVHTDHKPLLQLLCPSPRPPPRIQDLHSKLVYESGPTNPADVLRRRPQPHPPLPNVGEEDDTAYINAIAQSSVLNALLLSDIQAATRADSTLQAVLLSLQTGMWDNNRTIGKVLHAAQLDSRDLRTALDEWLLAHRSTPHPTRGLAPATVMFGGSILDTLPSLCRPQHQMRPSRQTRSMRSTPANARR